MNLRQNLVDLFKVVAEDEELYRLLYYPDEPLDASNPDVKSLDDFAEIKKERLMRSPKSPDLSNEPICRVCMYLGNREIARTNTQFSHQDVVFDIYVHVDEYEINDARSLWIADRLNALIHDKSITGFSKTKTDRMLLIANAPNGYIGYKCIYTFVSENFR